LRPLSCMVRQRMQRGDRPRFLRRPRVWDTSGKRNSPVSSVTTIINDSTLVIYPAVATFYRDGSWLFCDAFAMSDLRMCVVSAIPAILRPVEQELTQLADLVRRGTQDGKQLDRQHAAVKAERPIHRSHRAGNAEASRTRSGATCLSRSPESGLTCPSRWKPKKPRYGSSRSPAF
jgi:hypothetical protein